MVPPPPAPRTAIKQIRDEKDITGQRLARMAGISYRTFLRAQRGEPVKPEVILSIADALKVSPYVVAPDVFTPPLDPRSIAPPRILPKEAYRWDSNGEVA
jgi:transcriptional regulator with XRE-family HTH domain